MKAVAFESELRSDQTLSVPAGVIERIPRGQIVHVLVLVPEVDDDAAWEQLAAAESGMGYADGDAIYDDILNR